MRAIIIDDKDARALLDSLKLESMQSEGLLSRIDPDKPATAREMHKAFLYVVVQWLQDQGASLNR